jgi:MOSC domain-containing protein YiiM
MVGKLEYITLRPLEKESTLIQGSVNAIASFGLEGDHYKKSGKREVTMIQAEHLEELSQVLGKPIPEGITRRNLVIRGVDLRSLINKNIKIGSAVFYCTGDCPPCKRMNEVLGDGAMIAMDGKGGITAKVVESGTLSAGDDVIML